MPVELRPPLSALTDWIRAVDVHHRHRLPLLVKAQRVLSGEDPLAEEHRLDLAERLERWRYQFLDEVCRRQSPLSRRLADVLDLAINELAGRARRTPRHPREALADTYRRVEEVERALECLDRNVPLPTVMHRARRLTCEQFTVRPNKRVGAGRRMRVYAPLYVSNLCVNHCLYCGFRYPQRVPRRHLSQEDAIAQQDDRPAGIRGHNTSIDKMGCLR